MEAVDQLTIPNEFPKQYEKPLNENYKERYEATMVLAGVGDAMGYKNGQWEFQTSSKIIHKEFHEMTGGKGMENFELPFEWRYSDDTAMHQATALALLGKPQNFDINVIGKKLAAEYVSSFNNMTGRAPGKSTTKNIYIVKQDLDRWNKIPYNDRGGGCGASMRAACIGLCFFNDIHKLIAVSIESARITHHNPIGYLGSFVAAYFTSLAIQNYKTEVWPIMLLQQKELIKSYIQQSGREVDKNLGRSDFESFFNQWEEYIKLRNFQVNDKKGIISYKFPKDFNVDQRHKFYTSLSKRGWGGSGGCDSVIIAYDAMLGSSNNWNELILRGVLHGGDNDSTGTICCAFYGALLGFKNVPEKNYIHLEDYSKIRNLGINLFQQYFLSKNMETKQVAKCQEDQLQDQKQCQIKNLSNIQVSDQLPMSLQKAENSNIVTEKQVGNQEEIKSNFGNVESVLKK